MPSFLPICILLIGQLFSSTATYLPTIMSEVELASGNSSRTKSLTASQIESAVSQIQSAVKASNSNITSLAAPNLDGYVINVQYTGSTCQTFLFGYQERLNTCRRSSATRYTYVIATTSEVISATFSDAQCTRDIQLKSSKYYTHKQCSFSEATFVFDESNIFAKVDLTTQR